MSRWEFTIKELKYLQQDLNNHQAIVESYVEVVLLRGYPVVAKKQHLVVND